MSKFNLPSFLKPFSCEDLVRVGRDYDGGYVVNLKDIKAADGLISLGISHDWSFEKQFSEINDVPIAAYDGSVTLDSMQKHYRKRLLRIERPKIMLEAFNNLRTLRHFFEGDRRVLVSEYVGKKDSGRYLGLDEVVDKFSFNKFFLKIDIEGSEYEILDEIQKLESNTAGLAIEFHSLSQNLDRIKKFIEDYSLTLVHTHINNCGPKYGDNCPELIELTFSSSQEAGAQVEVLPTHLDMSNSPKLADPEIVFTADS